MKKMKKKCIKKFTHEISKCFFEFQMHIYSAIKSARSAGTNTVFVYGLDGDVLNLFIFHQVQIIMRSQIQTFTTIHSHFFAHPGSHQSGPECRVVLDRLSSKRFRIEFFQFACNLILARSSFSFAIPFQHEPDNPDDDEALHQYRVRLWNFAQDIHRFQENKLCTHFYGLGVRIWKQLGVCLFLYDDFCFGFSLIGGGQNSSGFWLSCLL